MRTQKIQFLVPLLLAAIIFGCAGTTGNLSNYEQTKKEQLETVKAGHFDGGRMWTFDFPPLDYFSKTYNFRPDSKWLEDVRMSSLKFATWCSASFVSADGLVMTNHHCARSSAVAVQKEGERFLENGFFAATLADERKVPDLFVEQLREIRDVTDKVQAAMEAGATDEDKIEARSKIIGEIQKAAEAETQLRAQVVTLYNGGKYSLYLFKRFTDVRLVLAPELAMGHFGGEWDNFTYPRYAQDFSFFRVYDDDGKPLKTQHYFTWSKAGATDGEAVFVVGNPGRTSRLNTTEQLEYNRDVQYPFVARMLNDRAAVLKEFVAMHPEKKEEMITQILGIANSQKAYNGRLAGLRDDVLMQRRRDFDRQFRAAVEANPSLKAKYGHIWDKIAASRKKVRTVANELYGLRMNGTGTSALLSKAYEIVKYNEQMVKPEADRDKAYQAASIEKTKVAMMKFEAPDKDMEILTLSKQLAMMKDMLGADDPIVRFACKELSPHDAAVRLWSESVLKDSNSAEPYTDGQHLSPQLVNDPSIAIAKLALPRLEAASKVTSEVAARDQVNATLLGRALFDIYGTSIPPDATFTIRLADGVVEGFPYNGTKAPSHTTYYGLYDRYHSHVGDEGWELPERWKNPPDGFDLGTPCNVSSTNDIIGGNSGSPMINKNKEVVGLVFDGNIESLPGDFIFAEDVNNRTVSVHSSGILEVLRYILRATRIVRELENGAMVSN